MHHKPTLEKKGLCVTDNHQVQIFNGSLQGLDRLKRFILLGEKPSVFPLLLFIDLQIQSGKI